MKNKYRMGLLAFAVVAGMTSCLKDKGYTDIINAVGAEPIVGIFGTGFGEHVLGVDFTTTAKNVELFSVNLGSQNLLSQDVTATLDVNPDLLKGTSYLLLPADSYTIPNKTVTIKAGQRDVPFMVAINSSKIDLTKSYALPITITSATGAKVATNLNNAIYAIKVNNLYSGVYKATGVFNHPTAGPRDINKDKTLATIDATTSSTEFADLGAAAQMWLKVNADNTVTLTPQGTASAATVQFGVNKYDPATKTFTLSYKYAGAGGDRVINETIKKK